MAIASWCGIEVKTIPARAAFSWLVDSYGPITVRYNNHSDVTIGNAEVWLQDEGIVLLERLTGPIRIRRHKINYGDPNFHAKAAEIIDRSLT